MNKELTLLALKKAKSVFEKNSIQYWLERGTLLGAIREKGFIPWDTDADLGLWYISLPALLRCKDEFGPEFELYYTNGHFSIRDKATKEGLVCLLLRAVYKGKYQWILYYPPLTFMVFALLGQDTFYYDSSFKKINIDLPKGFVSLMQKIPNGFRNFIMFFIFKTQITFRLFRRRTVADGSPFSGFKMFQFIDAEYPVPEDYKKYLTDFFGDDWMIPKPGWKKVFDK